MHVRIRTNLGSAEFDPLAPPDAPPQGDDAKLLGLLKPEITLDLGAGITKTWAPWGAPSEDLAQRPWWTIPVVGVLAVFTAVYVLGALSK